MIKRTLTIGLILMFSLSAGSAMAIDLGHKGPDPVKKKIVLTDLQTRTIRERHLAQERRDQLSDAQKKVMLNRALQDRLYVRGSKLEYDVPPIIKNERTLIPVAAIAKSLGAEVSWDQAANKVTIIRDVTTIEIILGETTVMVNGEPVTIDVAAESISNRTFVPLRFISQTLGEKVEYDSETGDIDIGMDEDVIESDTTADSANIEPTSAEETDTTETVTLENSNDTTNQ